MLEYARTNYHIPQSQQKLTPAFDFQRHCNSPADITSSPPTSPKLTPHLFKYTSGTIAVDELSLNEILEDDSVIEGEDLWTAVQLGIQAGEQSGRLTVLWSEYLLKANYKGEL